MQNMDTLSIRHRHTVYKRVQISSITVNVIPIKNIIVLHIFPYSFWSQLRSWAGWGTCSHCLHCNPAPKGPKELSTCQFVEFGCRESYSCCFGIIA